MKPVVLIACIFLVGTLIPSLAMETETKKRIVTPEMIADNEITFKKFVQELEETKWPQLQRLPDPTSFIGGVVVGAINFVTINFTRYGALRPNETKKFLGRVFETPHTGEAYEIPPLLKQGIDALKKEEKFLDYVNGVLNQLTETDLKNQDLAQLAQAMEEEKKKYPAMPGSLTMDDKAKVPDAVFAPFAAAQLFATCCMEERLLLVKKDKKSKHPHSKKHDSIGA